MHSESTSGTIKHRSAERSLSPPRSWFSRSLLTHVFPSIHFSFLLTDFSAKTIRSRRFTETGCDLVEPLSHAETFSSVFKVLSLRFYKRLIPVEDVALTVMAFCPPRISSGHTCKGHMFLQPGMIQMLSENLSSCAKRWFNARPFIFSNRRDRGNNCTSYGLDQQCSSYV